MTHDVLILKCKKNHLQHKVRVIFKPGVCWLEAGVQLVS